MKKYSEWLYRVSTNRVTLAWLVVFLLFALLVLPKAVRTPWIEAAGLPDIMLHYSSADLYAMAETYGSAGRAAFVRWHFTDDLIFPIIYTVFLLTASSWLIQRVSPSAAWLRRLNLFPLIGAFFDILENVTTSFVMAHYPASSPLAASSAPIITSAKWLFIGLSALVLIVMGATAIRRCDSPKRGNVR